MPSTIIEQFRARQEAAVLEAFRQTISSSGGDVTLQDLADVLSTPAGRLLSKVRLAAVLPARPPRATLPSRPTPAVRPVQADEPRIARYLLEVAGSTEVVQQTRQAIACEVPTSREAVSMALAEWKRAGIVEFFGRNVRILDRQALAGVARTA